MPIDPSIVVAGVGALGTAANAFSQGKTNRKSREWNERMYAIQKHDNIAQWHMQNAYNTPEAQMQRLKEAGLNPNLVYGHGQAVQSAGSIDSASAPTWSPRAPQVDLAPVAAGSIATYYDTRMKQAQIDNMKTQNTVLVNEALLKLAQMASLGASTEKTKLDTKLQGGLFDNTLAMAEENLRKLTYETELSATRSFVADNTADADVKAKHLQVDKIVKDMLEQDSRMKSMSIDQALKTIELKLQKIGINANDPTYLRMIGRVIADHYNVSNFNKYLK